MRVPPLFATLCPPWYRAKLRRRAEKPLSSSFATACHYWPLGAFGGKSGGKSGDKPAAADAYPVSAIRAAWFAGRAAFGRCDGYARLQCMKN